MKVYELYEDEDHYYIITEFLEGGELFDNLVEHGVYDEVQASIIMRQIFSAILYCHKKNIVHR